MSEARSSLGLIWVVMEVNTSSPYDTVSKLADFFYQNYNAVKCNTPY